jgi:hypothetical protein
MLKEILMRRDGLSSQEADEAIAEARWMVANGADPEEILHDEFQVESDYIYDLI